MRHLWFVSIVFVIGCTATMSDRDGDTPQQVPYKFPTTWSDPVLLTTTDKGNYDPAVVQAFNGDIYNFHVVGLQGDPFVIWEDGLFRMWFTANAIDRGVDRLGTAYSESRDGLLWTDTKNIPTLVDQVLTPSGWDLAIETVAVLRHPVDDDLMLYYAGVFNPTMLGYTEQTAAHAYYIGLARSPDGLSWAKHPQPVLTDVYPWEAPVYFAPDFPDPNIADSLQGGVMEPSLVYDEESGLFKLWYSALGVNQATWGGRIGYAASPDGITWTRSPTPVFGPGPVGAWDSKWTSHSHVVPDPYRGFHLFYAAEGDTNVYGIGHAYSVDGLTWERNPNNPIVTNVPSSWRGVLVGGPCALFYDGKIYLWFMGAPTVDFSYVHFALTTAECASP